MTTANGDLMNCIIMEVLETDGLHTIARVSMTLSDGTKGVACLSVYHIDFQVDFFPDPRFLST